MGKQYLVCYSVTVGVTADSIEEAENLANKILGDNRTPDQDWNLEYIDDVTEEAN